MNILLNQLIQGLASQETKLSQALILLKLDILQFSVTEFHQLIASTIRYNHYPFLKDLFTFLKNTIPEKKIEKILLHTDEIGDNVLHVSAQYASDVIIYFIVENLGNNATRLAKQINSEFELPIGYLKLNKNITDRISISLLFRSLTRDHSLKPISEEIIYDKLLERHKDLVSTIPNLAINLLIGCVAANHVRRLVKFSSSHPLVQPHKMTLKIANKVELMRREFEERSSNLAHLNQDERIKGEVALTTELCKKYGVANCEEISDMTIDTMIKMGIKLPFVAYGTNDDHVFVLLGNRRHDLDYRLWDQQSVVVDSLFGEVFPAVLLPLYLKDLYKEFQGKSGNLKMVSYLYPYNPKFQTVSPYRAKLSNNFFDHNTPHLNEDFSEDEIKIINHWHESMNRPFQGL